MDWLWFILLGLLVGGMSGFFGVGGGVLLVPMLVYVMGFEQKQAQGTSLALLCLPVVGFAAARYYQKGYVNLPCVGWIMLGFLVGSFSAASLVDKVSSTWLQRGFACFLLYIAIIFLFGEERRTRAILPAAVASIIMFVASWLFGKRKKKTLEPPQLEPDYHI